MNKRFVIFCLLIVISLNVSSLYAKPINAQIIIGISIKPDGSIEGTDKIQRDGDIYTLTADIEFPRTKRTSIGISVQKDNIIINGKGFALIQTSNLSSTGVDLSERFNVTIQNLNIKGFSIGIDFRKKSNEYRSATNNTISKNTITASNTSMFQVGIWVQSSTCNRIIDNKVTGFNEYGVYFHNTFNNYLSGNTITDNNVGFSVEYSGNNILRNNQMYNNEQNFNFEFRTSEPFIQDIDASNTVNRKPICFWIDQHNKTVSTDVGCVVLWNCSGITVQQLNLENNGVSILLYSTENSFIQNNQLQSSGRGIEIRVSEGIKATGNKLLNNGAGINVEASCNVTIAENNVTNNGVGIDITGFWNSATSWSSSKKVSVLANNITGNNCGVGVTMCNENVISGNRITRNNSKGLSLVHTSENFIVGNSFLENVGYAIYWSGAHNNTFYHNNFIHNNPVGYQVSNPWYIGEVNNNLWDNGSEGNYWSGYASSDAKTNDSGVLENPFVINQENIDRYPLVKPVDIEVIPEFPSNLFFVFILACSLTIMFMASRKLSSTTLNAT